MAWVDDEPIFGESQGRCESDEKYAARVAGQIASLSKTVSYLNKQIELREWLRTDHLAAERDVIAQKIANKQDWLASRG